MVLFFLIPIVAVFGYGSDKKGTLANASQMVKVYDAHGSRAAMAFFEKRGDDWIQVGAEWPVNIGRHGLGKRQEGDGKTPVGVFALGDVYAYKRIETKMPLFVAFDEKMICVDDPKSRYYDRIVDKTRVIEDFKSYEPMHRKDGLYERLVTVAYNPSHKPGKGSCIFLHIAHGDKPTAGCVAMPKIAMEKLTAWLDPKKHPVLVVERWRPAARFASISR